MAGQQNGSAPPRTNGAAAPNELETLCRDLKAKVDVFLDTPTEDELLNSVKNQIIVARGVIDEALRRYRCVIIFHPTISLYCGVSVEETENYMKTGQF